MLLMTLDLYYSNFTNVGRNLEKLYAKFLVEDNANALNSPEKGKPQVDESRSPEVSSLSALKTEIRGIGSSGRHNVGPRVNKEYIGRPLKASDRLTYARKHSVPEIRQEQEEIAQEKLFEQQFEDMRNRSRPVEVAVIAPVTIETIAEDDGNAVVAVTPSPPTKSTKERRADKAHFLVRPMSSRQRLKSNVPAIQQPPEHSDWYTEVENHSLSTTDITQTSPQSNASINSSHHLSNLNQNLNYDTNQLENSKNHLNISPHSHSNYSNPVSPNEIQRHNHHNHSFRSSKSDRSTQSVDRNLESNTGYKVYENRRNNQRGGGGSNNYNNYGSHTWGRGNRKYRGGGGGGGAENNKDKNYQSYDRFNRNPQDGYKNGVGDRSGSYSDSFGRKSPMPSANHNKYQRQQSVESESGVQKRFNLQNNRQFNNSNSSFSNGNNNVGSANGNRGSGTRYQSKNGHRPLQRSASKQSDDENWNNSYNDRLTPVSKPNSQAAQYSKEFLKYLED